MPHASTATSALEPGNETWEKLIVGFVSLVARHPVPQLLSLVFSGFHFTHKFFTFFVEDPTSSPLFAEKTGSPVFPLQDSLAQIDLRQSLAALNLRLSAAELFAGGLGVLPRAASTGPKGKKERRTQKKGTQNSFVCFCLFQFGPI